MRSELFEEAWKQNRHVWESTKCLAQAMYLAGEKHQQSKVDELQKRVDSLEKAEFKLAQVKAILQNNPKLLESILVKKIEQALKGEQP